MSCCDYGPYTLPTIDFVGGETQDLAFNVYFHATKRPFSLSGCTCNFSIVNYLNKTGAPILTKPMRGVLNKAGTSDNLLIVTLLPHETLELTGKYIYQITIEDPEGTTEIPKQGILYITNNIDKDLIR